MSLLTFIALGVALAILFVGALVAVIVLQRRERTERRARASYGQPSPDRFDG